MSDNNILVLGANGMLGKMVSLYLKSNNELNVFVTSRSKNSFIEENFEKTCSVYPGSLDHFVRNRNVIITEE